MPNLNVLKMTLLNEFTDSKIKASSLVYRGIIPRHFIRIKGIIRNQNSFSLAFSQLHPYKLTVFDFEPFPIRRAAIFVLPT